MSKFIFKPALVAFFVMLANVAMADATSDANIQNLQQQINQLTQQLGALQNQLSAVQQQQAVSKKNVEDIIAADVVTKKIEENTPSNPNRTTFSSYGEINLNHFDKQLNLETDTRSNETKADVRRVVLGFNHQFDEKNKMVAEIEWEHGVVSKDDEGETEIEQAFIEHQFNNTWSGKAGLFLIPSGLLNLNHEPTSYYGVNRNFVETYIIPTTWREGGVQANGQFLNGLNLSVGITTGFNANRWDATSPDGKYAPLAAMHQEMQLADGKDPAGFVALNYMGIPGLMLGASVFNGNVAQSNPTNNHMNLILGETHARYTPGTWDLSALYARGHISNTAGFNIPLVGFNSLMPESFYGGYVQVANKIWQKNNMSLAPFFRYERWNSGSQYAFLGDGVTPDSQATQSAYTAGVNLQVVEGIVLKLDAQHWTNGLFNNSVNLGVGWSF